MTDNGALALASILHDTYGCRITCRSGRLANDRHPSHAEAYLDTATAVLASLDAAGWALVRDAGNPLADREQAATIATLRAQYAAQLNLTIETKGEIDTLRADAAATIDQWADALTEIATLRAAIQFVLDDAESQHPGGWGPDVTMVAVLQDALATAKEAAP